MRRTHVIALVLLAAVISTAAMTRDPSRKGIRAVIIHGAGVDSPIRFGDHEQASALYNAFVRVMNTGSLVTDRESFRHRPCLGFAVYGMKWQDSVVDGLRLEDADYKLFYYPAMNGRPTTLFDGTIVPDSVAAAWSRIGIPVTATPEMRPPCEFH